MTYEDLNNMNYDWKVVRNNGAYILLLSNIFNSISTILMLLNIFFRYKLLLKYDISTNQTSKHSKNRISINY